MATIKAYTDLEQSKRLAEFLSHDSADMGYLWNGTSFCEYPVSNQTIFKRVENIPCWSLVGLLSVLQHPRCFQSAMSSHWVCGCFDKDRHYHEVNADNPIDACVEMILMLKEKNLL